MLVGVETLEVEVAGLAVVHHHVGTGFVDDDGENAALVVGDDRVDLHVLAEQRRRWVIRPPGQPWDAARSASLLGRPGGGATEHPGHADR